MKTPLRSAASHNLFKAYSSPARWSGSSAEEEGPNHQVVSFKSPADTCAYRLCHPNIVPMETAEPSD